MSTSRSSRPASSRSRAAIRPRTASSPKSRSASATCSAAARCRARRVQYGQRTRGFELSFVEPYFLDYRLALRHRLVRQADRPGDVLRVLRQQTIGGGFRFGIPLREDLALQLRYSVYRQKIDADQILRNCNNINPDFVEPFPTPTSASPTGSMPARYRRRLYRPRRTATPTAKRRSRSQRTGRSGAVLTSLVGYTLIYNTLDNNRNPTSGLLAEFKQDFAGVGGDVNFIRTTGRRRATTTKFMSGRRRRAARAGRIHLPAGAARICACSTISRCGPNLVRGFAPAGIGPRDLTPGTDQDALGGTMYWGAIVRSADADLLPAEGFRHAARGLRRRGLALGLQGPDSSADGLTRDDGTTAIRSLRRPTTRSAPRSARAHLGFAVRSAAVRLRLPAHQGVLRPDAELRFGGGTKF